MGKAATQNCNLWPSTLTTRAGPANIDVYRRRLSRYKTLPPRRFLSHEIQAQCVGRRYNSLLPDIVSTHLSRMTFVAAGAFYALTPLDTQSFTTHEDTRPYF
jgi:hypothetical protein